MLLQNKHAASLRCFVAKGIAIGDEILRYNDYEYGCSGQLNMASPIPSVFSEKDSLYETDFYAWTQRQALLLRNQQWPQIDLENVVEEIESLGRQQRQELRNRLAILIGHLLKWEYQPEKRSRSWFATINVQRLDIDELIADNPSLKPYLVEALEVAYKKGLMLAVKESGLPSNTFPSTVAYSLEVILSEDFYPGDATDMTGF